MPRSLRAQRIGGLDEVAPRRADRDRDHQDDLEHRADEDDEQLLQLADAGPQDQQRNEGGGRQIARKGDERLEEGLDRLVGAHQRCRAAPRRWRPARSRRRRARWSCRCRSRKPCLTSRSPAFLHHGQRIGEEDLRHVAAEGRPGPEGNEQHEEGKAEATRCLDVTGSRGRIKLSIRAVNKCRRPRRETGPAAPGRFT